MAVPTTVLTVIKRFNYRGVPEDWSNTYMLSGSTPADAAAWRTLFDALVTQEKTLYSNLCSVVHGYGYDKIPEKGDHAIWTVDLTVAPNTPVVGTLPGTGATDVQGDSAAWIRWGLNRFSSPGGKRVYLRKYYHAVRSSSTAPDTLSAGWTTAATAFGTKLRDGSFADSRTIVDKLGNVPIGAGVSTYMTTRTLKRRGKRPS